MRDNLKVVWSISLIFLYACSFLAKESSLPKCESQLENLILEVVDFPTNWSKGTPHQDDENNAGAIQSCSVSFYILNGVAIQEVLRFENKNKADRGFSDLLDLYSWDYSKTTSTLSYRSEGADDSYNDCATPRDTPMCRFVAQYGEYIVFFNTHDVRIDDRSGLCTYNAINR